MDRGIALREGLELTGISQSELSRITGVPQSRISRYVRGQLEPSRDVFDRLMSGLGLRARVIVEPVEMERTKLRSWLLHREVASMMGDGVPEWWWDKMARGLAQQRGRVHGDQMFARLDRWAAIIKNHDTASLRSVLIDPGTDGIDLREVSPMAGILPEQRRRAILDGMSA